MDLWQCLCNIRTHAVIVGALQVLGAILSIVTLEFVYQGEVEHMPEVDPQNTFPKYIPLAVCILTVLFAIVYWIGFLMRKRWCLTLNMVFMAFCCSLGILEIKLTIGSGDIKKNTIDVASVLTYLYFWLVIHQLRAVYLEEELADRQNDIALETIKGVQ